MYVFSGVNILLIFVLAAMVAAVLQQSRSKAQMAFILFAVFVAVFMFGLELELIHSNTIDGALSGLAVQYFGQCGFLIALLLFADMFIDMKVPHVIFVIQFVVSILTMSGIMTAGNNDAFYQSMRIVQEGMFPRIACTNGPLWYVHYAYFFMVFLYIIVFCLWKYHLEDSIHKRRILYLMSGLAILLAELALKGMGLFGSYNPVGFALTGMVFCLLMGVVKEGYFDSVDATIENVLNHGDEGLIVLDVWSRVIFVNEKADTLFPDIKIGLPLSSQGKLTEVMQNMKDTISIRQEIWEVRKEDIMENHVKTGVMIYFINVTNLVHQSEELKKINDERVRFMTKISHELRSPLNVALGADEMILKKSRDASVRQYAEMIREDIGSMVGLVEDIINSSMAEQNILAIKKEKFSLNDLLKHMNTVYQAKAGDKGLQFSLVFDGISLDEHEEVILSGDRKRLLQILINLLDNAVKYTNQGSFGLSVNITKTTNDKVNVEFAVSDTGRGIPASEQHMIFEKYKRGKEAENSPNEGLGLGLSIVKTFLDAMGGTIRLTSVMGKGSTFTVDIPFEKEVSSLDEEDENDAVPSFAGKRILAADDRPRNIMMMRHQLKDSGITIDEADNGMDAVKKCREVCYDALLIDYMMPGMDGIETLRRIRSDEKGRNRETYAIVFSANVTPDAEKMYYEAGFSDFLSKPVYYHELIKALQKAFEGCEDKGIFFDLEKLGVNTKMGMEYSDGDQAFYLELLQSFADGYEKEKSGFLAVYECVENGEEVTEDGLNSWKEFTRIAHGIKGELRAFGDDNGAEMFYSLEKDGKSEVLEDIKKVLPEALRHLDAFVQAVREN